MGGWATMKMMSGIGTVITTISLIVPLYSNDRILYRSCNIIASIVEVTAVMGEKDKEQNPISAVLSRVRKYCPKRKYPKNGNMT